MRYYSLSPASVLPLIVWVIALSVPLTIAAQQPNRGGSVGKGHRATPKVRFDSGNSALRIPLEIDNNIILMRLRVNNSKPLKFIFDTGASISVISSKGAADLGLKTQGRFRGDATGGKIEGSAIKRVVLSVQGAQVSDQTIAAIPFPTPPGFEFDGIIGYDFISQFVVEIDYPQKIMNLYSPQTYHYSGAGTSIPLLLVGRKTPMATLEISLDGRATITANLEVDTGADNTFLLNSPFVKRHKFVERMENTTQESRNGAGGEQRVIVGRVKAVRLGPFILNNPPIFLSLDTEGSGASEENDGVIGGEIFRRFKLILDYSRKQMILEPNKNFNDPYDLEQGATG